MIIVLGLTHNYRSLGNNVQIWRSINMDFWSATTRKIRVKIFQRFLVWELVVAFDGQEGTVGEADDHFLATSGRGAHICPEISLSSSLLCYLSLVFWCLILHRQEIRALLSIPSFHHTTECRKKTSSPSLQCRFSLLWFGFDFCD